MVASGEKYDDLKKKKKNASRRWRGKKTGEIFTILGKNIFFWKKGWGERSSIFKEYLALLYLACVPGLEPAGAGELLRGGSGLVQVLRNTLGPLHR